jgi:hypothetical protein
MLNTRQPSPNKKHQTPSTECQTLNIQHHCHIDGVSPPFAEGRYLFGAWASTDNSLYLPFAHCSMPGGCWGDTVSSPDISSFSHSHLLTLSFLAGGEGLLVFSWTSDDTFVFPHLFLLGTRGWAILPRRILWFPTQKTTQGQICVFPGQLPFKCYLPGAASVGD